MQRIQVSCDGDPVEHRKGRCCGMTKCILLAAISAMLLNCASTSPPRKARPRTGTKGPLERIPMAPGPEACADVPLLTVAEIAAGAGDGEVIAVEGVPVALVTCTALLCDPDPSHCCNECSGGYALSDTYAHTLWLTEVGNCGDRDCNLDCEPFGRKPTKAYRFVGKHAYTPRSRLGPARSIIHVERYCRTE